MPHAAPLLESRGLTVTVAGRVLVKELSFVAPAGKITCILGCNGAGKTLTLHTLAGLRPAQAGAVLVVGRRLRDWPRRQLARHLGLLMQITEDPFPSTAMETVLVGRHPHIAFWQWESEQDVECASKALAAVGMAEFATREVGTLSGGERRRTAIAAMLAQDPEIMLLDEPTNHLDPHHQLDALRLFRAKADAGRAVVMSLHDVGHAARFSDQVLLLFGNGDWLCGPTDTVLTEPNIARLYGVPVRELSWEGGRTFVAV